jgi:flavin-dependent dehydrogenase
VIHEVTAKSSYVGNRAIVIGAGISGLSAARALADSFEQVIVLERDKLSNEVEPRAGVPQSKHPHGILSGAAKELDELFPGFGQDILQAGGLQLDFGTDLCAELPGFGALPRRDWELQTYALSRPLIELLMRRRVQQQSNITILDGRRVLYILGSPDGSVVTGIRCETIDGNPETFSADVVVDASSSNGAITLDYLKSKAKRLPEQTTLGVDIRYATAVFAMPKETPDDYKAFVTFPKAPESVRYGYLLPAENQQWQLLLIGRGEDVPPGDFDGFMEFAQGLETPTIYNAIKDAKLLYPIARFGIPESQWRHFGKLDTFPRGLLPIGDAYCRFNPVHGQGIPVAVQEANALRRLLRIHALDPDPIASLTRAYLTEAEVLVETPWALSSLPDPEIHKLLLEVQHLLKPRHLLDDPELKARVEEEMAAATAA